MESLICKGVPISENFEKYLKRLVPMNLFESRSRRPNRDPAPGCPLRVMLPKPFYIMTHTEKDSICMKQQLNGGFWNPT